MKRTFSIIMLLMSIGVGFCQNLNAGLLIYVPANGGSWQDVAGAGSYFFSSSGITPTADALGNANSAMKFSGLYAEIRFQSNGLLDFGTTGSFSYVTDFKSITANNQPFFTDYSDSMGWSVGLVNVNVGKFSFEMGGTLPISISTTNTYNDNVWHQAVVTVDRNANIIKIYVDGVLQNIVKNGQSSGVINNNNELDISASGANANPGMFLGGSPDTRIGNDYAGSLDEMRFYNRVLTLTEITLLYNQSFTTSNESDMEENGISVYPNPMNDYIHISLKNIAEKASISLKNYVGQEVLKASFSGSEWIIDGNNISNGVYFLEIILDGKVITTKIIK